jgi:hypothetical protein
MESEILWADITFADDNDNPVATHHVPVLPRAPKFGSKKEMRNHLTALARRPGILGKDQDGDKTAHGHTLTAECGCNPSVKFGDVPIYTHNLPAQ